jgi:hypothetical protein
MLPQTDSIWVKVAKPLKAGWNLSARADVASNDFANPKVRILAANKAADLSLKATGSPTGVDSLEGSKSFVVPNQGGARVTVNPRYAFPSGDAAVTVAYDTDSSSVEADVSQTSQTIVVSKQIDAKNRLTPTFDLSKKSMTVRHDLSLQGGGSLSTTLKPGEEVATCWVDGGWVCDVTCPLEGVCDITGAKVSVRKDIEF